MYAATELDCTILVKSNQIEKSRHSNLRIFIDFSSLLFFFFQVSTPLPLDSIGVYNVLAATARVGVRHSLLARPLLRTRHHTATGTESGLVQ